MLRLGEEDDKDAQAGTSMWREVDVEIVVVEEVCRSPGIIGRSPVSRETTTKMIREADGRESNLNRVLVSAKK